jgi:Myo-inositol-1-phosphate synthase
VLTGSNQDIITQLRKDIRCMKEKTDKVVVLWTANTEMFLLPEIDSVEELLR